MNDGELVVHTICTILNYEKSMNRIGTPLAKIEFATLWESFRIALFPHLSESFLKNKFKEVLEADEKIPKLAQQMVNSSDGEGEIIP
jgi:hypothetical protein